MTHRVTLKNGFKLTIDDEVLKDYEFIDAYTQSTDEDIDDDARLRAYMKMVDIVFGKQKKALFEKIKKDNDGKLGEVPFELLGDAIVRLNALMNGKN